MIRAVIIDDIPEAITVLKADLENYCVNIEVVGSAEGVVTGAKLIKEIKEARLGAQFFFQHKHALVLQYVIDAGIGIVDITAVFALKQDFDGGTGTKFLIQFHTDLVMLAFGFKHGEIHEIHFQQAQTVHSKYTQ